MQVHPQPEKVIEHAQTHYTGKKGGPPPPPTHTT